MDTKKTGNLIARIRKEQGKTQKDIADELHVASATISKWERGVGFPDISLIEPLAKSLDISIAEIFDGQINNERNAEYRLHQIVEDVVRISSDDKRRREKQMNWLIAITFAFLYLSISIITKRWELTWIIWFVYCFYRILFDYILKKF